MVKKNYYMMRDFCDNLNIYQKKNYSTDTFYHITKYLSAESNPSWPCTILHT